MFYSTPCSCKCIFIFVRIDIHAYIGGLQRLNNQRYCVRNCALRVLAHRNFSSQVLTIRALYDAFQIVISRIVTFLKSYRNCLVSLDLRSSFEIVTPESTCSLFARLAWRFPGSPATARDGKLIQMPHSCHHAETIRHPNSSYVTTKLYGTSTRGCNNNRVFSKRAILTFLTVDVCRAH